MSTPPPLPSPISETELAGPVVEARRIEALDVLRGFAILGILVMNIQSFSMIEAAYFNPAAYGDLTGANFLVWLLSHILAEGKFITLFSLLFGAGIVLMTSRREAAGRAAAGVHYRRMGVLLLFGLLHAYLLWYGDILFAYAVCGMIVYLCRRWRPAILMGVGVAGVALASAMWSMSILAVSYAPPDIQAELELYWWPPEPAVEEELAAYRGSWFEQMSHRAPMALYLQTVGMLMYLLWWAGGMMLIGMGLFKLGVLSAARPIRFYVALLGAGALGLALTLWRVWPVLVDPGWIGEFPFTFPAVREWAALLMALGYLALIMIVCRARVLLSAQRVLAAVGRMALTNYLLQSVICTTIFYGHGFGLFGAVERTGQIVIVIGVWAVQLAISPLWLRHFQFGPVEWLWRALTYGQAPPMRRREKGEIQTG